MVRTVAGMDTIWLRGLRAFGHHGVLADERRDGQEFVVDAVLELDLAPAGESDVLADTVDYGALAQGLHDDVARDPLDLIEALAERLVRRCLADPRVRAAEVTVHKPSAPIAVAFGDVVGHGRRR